MVAMGIPQLLQRRLLVLEAGMAQAMDPHTEAGWGERSLMSGNIPVWEHDWVLRPLSSSLLLVSPAHPCLITSVITSDCSLERVSLRVWF
jgi:hypothetical protein